MCQQKVLKHTTEYTQAGIKHRSNDQQITILNLQLKDNKEKGLISTTA